ncbi:MAG: FAD-dependent oxidoreductase [bacterium]
MKLYLIVFLFVFIAFSQQLKLLPTTFFKTKEVAEVPFKISFFEKADVVVVGGGPAGCGAALASASKGRDVILIERFDFLGGAGTAMGVSLFMEQNVVGGFYEEIRERLKEKGGLKGNAYDPDIMKAVLYEMCKEKGVKLIFNSWAFGVVKESKRIKGILIHIPGLGTGIVEGQVFIDATGDGDIAAAAGAPFEVSPKNKIMPLTLCYTLWWRNGWPPLWRNYGAVWRMDPYRVFANQTRVLSYPLDPCQLTEAEVEGREEMISQVKELKEKSYPVELLISAPHIGIRESRRIIGDYILKEEDLLEGKMFEDRIALCNYPIDIHYQIKTSDLQAKTGRLDKVHTYSIPYRCLLPKGLDNLLVAGRCISATQEAMASFRIQPTSIAIGTAAGVASAIAVEKGISPREIDIKELQTRLRELGQIIDKPEGNN